VGVGAGAERLQGAVSGEEDGHPEGGCLVWSSTL